MFHISVIFKFFGVKHYKYVYLSQFKFRTLVSKSYLKMTTIVYYLLDQFAYLKLPRDMQSKDRWCIFKYCRLGRQSCSYSASY